MKKSELCLQSLFSEGEFVSYLFVPGDVVKVSFEATSFVEIIVLSYGEKPTEKGE